MAAGGAARTAGGVEAAGAGAGAWWRPVVRVEAGDRGNGARVVAPGHGLQRGTRVAFQGVAGLEEELCGETATFLVCWADGPDSFYPAREVFVPIVRVDAASGTVETATAHGLQRYDSPRLFGFEGEGAEQVNGKRLSVDSMEACSVTLCEYKEDELGDFRKFPLRLPADLRGGQLLCGSPRRVELADKVGRGGRVVLAPLEKSRSDCIADWAAAVQAAQKTRVPISEVAPTEFREPAADVLEVGLCGSECEGTYIKGRPGEFVSGASRIAFVPELGVWCLTVDLNASMAYKLRRAELKIPRDWEGPQLLYICAGACPTGLWQPVLGQHPAPIVRAVHERPAPTAASPSPGPAPHRLWTTWVGGPAALGSPRWPYEFGTMLPGMLFAPVDPMHGDHRERPSRVRSRFVKSEDGIGYSMVRNHDMPRRSALQVAAGLAAALDPALRADLLAASTVSAAWRAALGNAREAHLTIPAMKLEAVRRLEAQVGIWKPGVWKTPTLRQAAEVLETFCNSNIPTPTTSLLVTILPAFENFTWAADLVHVAASADLPKGDEGALRSSRAHPRFEILADGVLRKHRRVDGPVETLLNGLAPALSRFAQTLLEGVPVAWSTSPEADGWSTRDERRMVTCNLLDDYSDATDALGPQLLCRNRMLATQSGMPLFEAQRLKKAVQVMQDNWLPTLPKLGPVTRTSTWVVTHSHDKLSKKMLQSCERGCARSSPAATGCRRCLGFLSRPLTELRATEELHFKLHDCEVADEVRLEIGAAVHPFCVTGRDSKEEALGLGKLLRRPGDDEDEDGDELLDEDDDDLLDLDADDLVSGDDPEDDEEGSPDESELT